MAATHQEIISRHRKNANLTNNKRAILLVHVPADIVDQYENVHREFNFFLRYHHNFVSVCVSIACVFPSC